MTGSPQALILSGGRYTDPWHDFPATSAVIAEILTQEGVRVEIADDVDDRLSRLDDVDLLVANPGDPTPNGEPPRSAEIARAGLVDYIDAGRSVLAVDISSWAFPGLAAWTDDIGCRWVPGHSSHPPNGPSHIDIAAARHPITEGLNGFDTIDERYHSLAPDLVPLASHRLKGTDFPLIWARERRGGRVVYSALGHSAESYDPATYREVVRRFSRWLLGREVSA